MRTCTRVRTGIRMFAGGISLSLTTASAEEISPTSPMNWDAIPDQALVVGLAVMVVLLLSVVVMLVRNNKLHQKLTHSNARFGLAIANAYEEIAELDLTSNEWYQVYLLNGMLEKTKMHQSLDVYVKRYIRERVYKDDVPTVRALLSPENLQALSRGNQGAYTEFRQFSPDGSVCWRSVLAQGLERKRGESDVVMLYVRNIDEVKKEEAKSRKLLVEALKDAERLSSVKTDFMNRISHEIRTPLNAIIGFLHIARCHLERREMLESCLNKAELASGHLLSLMNDVLDLSAVESGKMRLDNHPFKLRDFINNLGSIYFEQARQAGVEFGIRLDGVTEEMLIGDDLRLNQVLMNLISNALKFTEAGGHVMLTVMQKDLREDTVHLCFEVADDGIGMGEEFRQRIFGSFEQEEGATARKYGGSGLGLSIVKNMTSVMGGSVEVQSKQGEGSTFTVNLPFGRCRCAELDSARRRAYAKLHALLVDDDQAALEYVATLFRKLDVACDTAISGDVALEKTHAALKKKMPYDIILVDWSMPGMSGAESCIRLRQAAGPEARIVAVRDYDSSAIEREEQSGVINRYLMRPLFQSTLVELLSELTEKQEQGPKAREPLPDLSGRRVLLVEDYELNREIGIELLKQVKVDIDTAENGAEALRMFEQSPMATYRMILMDIQMPVMDGLTATRQIRACSHPDAKHIPIIAMSANAFPEDVSQSLAAGMNGHLAKPIDTQELYSLLQTYLG